MYNIHLCTSILIVDSDTLMGFSVCFVLFRICNQIQTRFILLLQPDTSMCLFCFVSAINSSTLLFCLSVYLLLCPSTVNIFCERGFFSLTVFLLFLRSLYWHYIRRKFCWYEIIFQLHTDVITPNGDVVGATILQDEGVQSERVNQPHVLELEHILSVPHRACNRMEKTRLEHIGMMHQTLIQSL